MNYMGINGFSVLPFASRGRFTNEYHVKMNARRETNKDVYALFEKLFKNVRKLQSLKKHDIIRFIISSKKLSHSISSFYIKIGQLNLDIIGDIVGVLDYKAISLDGCKIIVQSKRIKSFKDYIEV